MKVAETEEQPLPVTPLMAAVMVIAVVGVFYLGLAPGRPDSAELHTRAVDSTGVKSSLPNESFPAPAALRSTEPMSS